MDRKSETTEPSTSTLWLAIGLGGFSVFASFFLAIYCSSAAVNDQTAAHEVRGFDMVEQASTN